MILTYAAFHWARKLVFIGNSLIYRSIEDGNVVFPSGKLGILLAPRLPTRK